MSDRLGLGGNAPPLLDRLQLEYAAMTMLADKTAEGVPAKVPPVTSEEDAAFYTERAGAIKDQIAKADEAFENEKKPWREGAKTVDTFFGFRKTLADAASRLSAAIGAWQTAQRAAALKAKAAEEALEREATMVFGGPEPARPTREAPVVAPMIASASGAKASGSVKWEHEVIDAAQVPRQYLMVNEAAIRAAIAGFKAQGIKIENAQIPGVRIFESVKASIRR